MVEGIVATVAPVPALKSAGSLHRQDLLVNRLPFATQGHRELGRRAAHGGDAMSPRTDASATQAAARTPRGPCRTYLVSDDCFVVIKARVQLPAAELTPPATGDGASADPAQRAPWQRHQKLALLFLPVVGSGSRTPPCSSGSPLALPALQKLLDPLLPSSTLTTPRESLPTQHIGHCTTPVPKLEADHRSAAGERHTRGQ